MKDDKLESSNQEHDKVLLIHNLFHVLQEIFHEMEGQFRSCGSSTAAASQEVGQVGEDKGCLINYKIFYLRLK